MRYFWSAALVSAALLAPSSAAAQSNDPQRGSPSGTIYEIPLDVGRGDAAPGGPDARAGSGEDASSPIHSANGFGSSSTVPGAEGQVRTEEERQQGAKSAEEEGSEGEGSGVRAKEKVRESDIPGGGQAAEPSVRVDRAATGSSPAVPRAQLMLALGFLVALGLAAAARVSNRGS